MYLLVQQKNHRVLMSFKVLFFLLGTLLLFFCGGCNMNAEEAHDYEEYVHEIVNDFKKKAKKNLSLICIGRGGRMPHGKVEEIEVGFIIYRKGTLEDARRLEIEATEMLLKKINTHEKIRPFLKVYPFTHDRAIVTISFRKPDNTIYEDGSVTFVFQAKNKIFYDSNDAVWPSAEEPYEEARKIVLGQEEERHENA